jgi:ubiquinone/menaquinone biosynthesis C-methylase UbiE
MSQWVGPNGSVTGIDVDAKLMDAARTLIEGERLSNVTLAHDDLFDSRLESHAFDLVHSRFEIGPLGRAADQLASYLRLVAPGGWVILEDPDLGTSTLPPRLPNGSSRFSLRRSSRPGVT